MEHYCNLKAKLPSSINSFIDACLKENIELVMYGSVVSDFFTHHTPNDYDFFVLSTYEFFCEKIAQKLNIQLNKYGNYILFDEDVYYFFTQDRIKVDVKFVGPQANKEELYIKDRRVIITISSLLYDISANCLIDKCGAITDLQSKIIKCYDVDKAIHSSEAIKSFVSYITYLHGKHPLFSLDKNQIDLIRTYVNNPSNHDYYEKFKWQKVTTLARALSYSKDGLKNIFHYWQQMRLLPFLIPEIKETDFEALLTQLNAGILDHLDELNKLTQGKLTKRVKDTFKLIPQSYFDCMPEQAQKILFSICKMESSS